MMALPLSGKKSRASKGKTDVLAETIRVRLRTRSKMSAQVGPSYTDTRLGIYRRVTEALSLLKYHRAGMRDQVKTHLQRMDAARSAIEALLGQPLVGKKILEIGCGQQLRQCRYFAADNRVVAIDLDEIVIGANLPALMRSLWVNGSIRFWKTLARKMAGFDRQFAAELIRQRPSIRGAAPVVIRRDASITGLASGSFDCVMSYSVFEHIPEPLAVLEEIFRLLRPGGVSHHVVHLYTSDSGAHDVRTFTQDRGGLPYWCHLQADQAYLSAPNCYVNQLTLGQWLALIERACPGATILHFRTSEPGSIAALAALRARGVLAEYTDEELLTNALQFTWKKPNP
jgi:2-polyprenyl-3-methyl-5-hydroxy-6-metoxy-1,4-benzoquinol methylase